MRRRIAIVEDDPRSRANLAEALAKHGYEVASFAARAEAMDAFAPGCPTWLSWTSVADDPDGGFTLCRELRALSAALPILFLSARDSDFDVVSGLRLGADDYLTKDASLPHLLARIGALFRRADALGAAAAPVEEIIDRGPLRLDLKRLTAHWRSQPVELTLTEFWMVHSLARHPGHVKSREQLMRDAELVIEDDSITSHVKRIRRKFIAVDPGFEAIESVYGMGYRWKESA